jgi:hypothetical protein
MKKIALILLAVAFFASVSLAKDKAPKAQKIDGWVSDEKCASHKGTDPTHADCVKKCADAGIALVFVTDKDKTIYKIDNADAVKGHEGHHVNVTATVTGDSVHIDKVSMLKQPKAAPQKGEHDHGAGM